MATDAPERIWVSKNTWTERKWSDPSDYGWYVLASRRLSPETVERLRHVLAPDAREVNDWSREAAELLIDILAEVQDE